MIGILGLSSLAVSARCKSYLPKRAYLMKISKKQNEFIVLLEKCGFLFRSEVNFQQYPESLIASLKAKGLVVEYKNKLTSTSGKS